MHTQLNSLREITIIFVPLAKMIDEVPFVQPAFNWKWIAANKCKQIEIIDHVIPAIVIRAPLIEPLES